MVQGNEEESEAKIKNLKNRRKAYKGRLTFFQNKYDNNEIVSLEEFESTLNRLRIIYDEYDKVQSAIEGELDDDDNAERLQFENNYGILESKILSKIKQFEAISQKQVILQNTPQSVAPVPSIKLPEFTLPKFSGLNTDWLKFRNRFKTLIHDNNNLDYVSKFQYLISSIESGKAYLLIFDLPITSENYIPAWKILCDHFDNEVAIKKEHISQLYDIEKCKDDSVETLEKFITTVVTNMTALKSLGVKTDEWDLFLNHHLLSRLHSSSRNEVIKKSSNDKILTYNELIDILRDRVYFLKQIKSVNSSIQSTPTVKDKTVRGQNFRSMPSRNFVTSVLSSCSFCNGVHSLVDCSLFKNNLNPRQRFDFVKSKNICGNCLTAYHRVSDCKKGTCSLCQLHHHVLLHFKSDKNVFPNNSSNPSTTLVTNNAQSIVSKDESPSVVNQPVNNSQTFISANSSIENSTPSHTQVFLATALVRVRGDNGIEILCRALIDNASQSNFITTAVCKMLGLRKTPVSIPITGISETTSQTNFKVSLKVSSRVSDFSHNLDCLVLPKITGNLPTKSIKFDSTTIPNIIDLADPSFYKSDKIDMLIGAEIYWKITTGQHLRIISEFPPFQGTVFGYVLSGKVNQEGISSSQLTSSFVCCHMDELSDQVQKFWQLEQIPHANTMSLEDKRCEEHYSNNVRRDITGRYIVALPLKDNILELGESHTNALRQYQYLEQKLDRNPTLRIDYNKFLEEYLAMGHMELVENPELITNTYNKTFYLPHHAVHRASSTTTKLRVVFNASSKSNSGLSLNECMLVGPTIQQDLFSIVIRFRKYKVALVGDLAKMYRQIKLDENDRDLLRIWWRRSPQEEIKCYRLSTVTYGTASAPFLAIRTLKQLAEDEHDKFQDASIILKRDFYVDDLLTGSDSTDEALKLKSDLINLLNLGGFELRKIESNDPKLSDNVQNIDTDQKDAVSILGIDWNKSTDNFEIKFKKLDQLPSITKSKLLSELMQLYDPMGFCAPMIFTGKLLVQSIFSNKALSWDDKVPPEMYNIWEEFKSELSKIDKFEIPRCVIGNPNAQSVELHGFGDASEKGFGCCIYVRVINEYGSCKVNLLCAKSRVAPLKKSTIPRLELCASLLLAQLMSKIISAMEFSFTNTYYWSDSEITLFRIKSDPSKYSTFVANRISQIQDMSKPENWLYVPSEMNPSDLVSRGLRPSELLESNLWWNGPEFLCFNKSTWPKANNVKFDATELELRKNVEISLPIKSEENKDLFSKFSSVIKLARTASICLRFKTYRRSTEQNPEKTFKPITPDEMDKALKGYIKYLQAREYATDIKSLKSSNTVSSKSSLKSLSPILDISGLLRVGGRLQNAEIPFDKRHPILLPSHLHFSKMIVEYEHHRNLHCGPQALLYHIRQKYWITNGRNLCRKVVNNCVRCFRTRPVTINQVMGQLPKSRVTAYTPFQVVGIDFCGPFTLTLKHRSKVQPKVYLAIFICFAVKGVHIEIVDDLSTESFIASLRRFISRRGLCTHIYSDNATNFVGAKSELAELSRLFQTELHNHKVQRFCAEQGIEWHNIPPRSPHFGGLWEAAVKSAKYHLKRVIGSSSINFEQLYTLVAQVEACLNSRPLTPLSNDPSDLQCLTPAHFWRGSPLNVLPEPSLQHLDFNRLSLFQRVQHQFQQFWKRWSNEYLTELQQKKKWLHPTKNIDVDSLVLLKEDNTPPVKWNLARVVEVHKGNDGYVRVVTVRTSDSVFKRAISKVCPLPISDNICQNND